MEKAQGKTIRVERMNDMATTNVFQKATLAGGCFWCLEAVYEQMRGVESVMNGYIGGIQVNPDYEAVCGGKTGHAEAVQITFDPSQVTYRDLLAVFFKVHDPTTVNRQGNDIGTQYRSAIFHHSEDQRQQAQAAIAELDASRALGGPVVTEVVAATTFYPAEEYHQHYFSRHPDQGYCQFVIVPKIAKVHEYFPEKLKREN
jgi:peptide-methionine (S)-S-oxide reductase